MLSKKPLVLFFNKESKFLYKYIIKDIFKVHQDFDPDIGIYRHIWNIDPSILRKLFNVLCFYRKSAIGYYGHLVFASQGALDFISFFYLLFIFFSNQFLSCWLDSIGRSRNKSRSKMLVSFLRWLKTCEVSNFRVLNNSTLSYAPKVSVKLFIYFFKLMYFDYIITIGNQKLNYNDFFRNLDSFSQKDKKVRNEKTHGRLKALPILDLENYEFNWIITEANLMDMLFTMEREEVKRAYIYEADEKGRLIVWLFTPDSKYGEYDMSSLANFETFFRQLVVVDQRSEEDVWNANELSVDFAKMYIFSVFPKMIRKVYHTNLTLSGESSLLLNAISVKHLGHLFDSSLLQRSNVSKNTFFSSFQHLANARYKRFYGSKNWFTLKLQTQVSKTLLIGSSFFNEMVKTNSISFFENPRYSNDYFKFSRDARQVWEVLRFRRHLSSIIFLWFLYKDIRSSNLIFFDNRFNFYALNYRFQFYSSIFSWLLKYYGWPFYPTLFQIRMFCRVSLGNFRLILFDTLRNCNKLVHIFPYNYEYTPTSNASKVFNVLNLPVTNWSLRDELYLSTLGWNYDMMSFFYLFTDAIVTRSINYWNYIYYYMLEASNFSGNAKDPFALDLELRSSNWSRNTFGEIRKMLENSWYNASFSLKYLTIMCVIFMFTWSIRFMFIRKGRGTINFTNKLCKLLIIYFKCLVFEVAI